MKTSRSVRITFVTAYFNSARGEGFIRILLCVCLGWRGEREGNLLLVSVWWTSCPKIFLNMGPAGNTFEPIPEVASFWWTWDDGIMTLEWQEDSESLKENGETMSKRHLMEMGVRMFSQSKHRV